MKLDLHTLKRQITFIAGQFISAWAVMYVLSYGFTRDDDVALGCSFFFSVGLAGITWSLTFASEAPHYRRQGFEVIEAKEVRLDERQV